MTKLQRVICFLVIAIMFHVVKGTYLVSSLSPSGQNASSILPALNTSLLNSTLPLNSSLNATEILVNFTAPVNSSRVRRDLMDKMFNTTFWNSPSRYILDDHSSALNASHLKSSNCSGNASLPFTAMNSTMPQLNRTRRGLMDSLLNSSVINAIYGSLNDSMGSGVLNASAFGAPAYSASIMNESLVMYPLNFTAPSSAALRPKRHAHVFANQTNGTNSTLGDDEDVNVVVMVVDDPLAMQNINMNHSGDGLHERPGKFLVRPLAHMSNTVPQASQSSWDSMDKDAQPQRPVYDMPHHHSRPARQAAGQLGQLNQLLQQNPNQVFQELASQGLQAISSYMPMYNMTMEQRFERVKGFGDSIQRLGGSIEQLSQSLRNVTNFLFGGQQALQALNQIGGQALPALQQFGGQALPALQQFAGQALPALQQAGGQALPAMNQIGAEAVPALNQVAGQALPALV